MSSAPKHAPPPPPAGEDPIARGERVRARYAAEGLTVGVPPRGLTEADERALEQLAAQRRELLAEGLTDEAIFREGRLGPVRVEGLTDAELDADAAALADEGDDGDLVELTPELLRRMAHEAGVTDEELAEVQREARAEAGR